MSALIKNIKPMFEKTISPIIDIFYKINITPNFLTILGLVITGIGSFFIAIGSFFTAGILILIGNLCDAVDGALARKYQKSSKFGAFLDSVVDRYSDFLPFAASVFYFHSKPYMLLLSVFAIAGSFLVSYSKARAEGLGIECNVGILERPERSTILIVSLLTGYLEIGIVLIAVGSHITALQRIFYVYKVLQSNKD
ncbi:MAG: CDP-alcohol phosphatidyltransferase family protein [Aquificae bacterium]|nr:CDP-alcohol phosphatidyltransferase family protein [Aquificota bacterium]